MADEQQSRDPGEAAGGPEELRQDPFVERLRRDPSQPPQPVRVLEGLLGNSDRAGYHRIYFTRELDTYAEFRAEDVVYREPVPPDQPPFRGLDASRVGIRRDAPVWYTQVRTPRPVDEFDLDIRLSRLGPRRGFAAPGRRGFAAPGRRGFAALGETTCQTQCGTCGQATCGNTECATQCGTCDPATCVDTQCGTCDTCQTQCDTCANTCQTCQTRCDTCAPDTCVGPFCNTHAFTCDDPNCQIP